MKLLIDANLSPRIAQRLNADGRYEASHVRDHGLLAASDEVILSHAGATGCVVVSADSDFATMLALANLRSPSLVLLRSFDHLTPDEQADLLLGNLPAVAQDLSAGAVVSITTERIRVRSLPIRARE
ncbi:MAG: hypothetical protein DLM55_09510 [Acidimicrobiales bacterium]|nr:MAG: hypothetical protein DLM55_09510 [Acidimicrobiales bacterium]